MKEELRRIHLVRHGESTWNAVRRVQGNHDGVHLSAEGSSALGTALVDVVHARIG